jgi:sugar/nucleoside kinase (ribokinase family)
MTEYDALVAGDAAITFAWQLSSPPVPGRTSKLLGKVDPEGRFGGCAPAIALALADAGHRVALVSWLGDDSYGREYLAMLRERGIDTSGVEVAAGQASPRALMLYDPSGTATCLHHPSGSGTLALPEPGRERLAHSRWLALTAGPAPMSEALLDARAKDTRVAWDVKADPRHYPPHLRRRILEAAGLVCLNRDELAFLAEALNLEAEAPAEEQIRRVREATTAVLVLTDGAAGSRIIEDEGTVKVAAAAVTAEDPTGVGDAFFAALLSATMRGADPRAAVEHATDLAADYLIKRERSA